jgi:hypothetical protein
MSEHRLWEYLRDGMGGAWAAQRHEDKLSTGIPDVSYSISRHGWIELKYISTKPSKSTSILRIPHYTEDQRNWLTSHGSRAGLCFLLLQVEKTYMVFDWTKAWRVATLPYADHEAMATAMWKGKIDWGQLRRILVTPVKRAKVTIYS